MRVNIRAADPANNQHLYQLFLSIELIAEVNTFRIKVINIRARIRGNKAYTFEQYRVLQPLDDKFLVIKQVFPQIHALLAYDRVCLRDLPRGYVNRVVSAAGVRDHLGHLPGEPAAYKPQILLADGSDLTRGMEDHLSYGSWVTIAKRLGLEVIKVPSAFSAGKPRDFEEARWLANWPEATDEELSLPEEDLRAVLTKRTPAYLRKLFQQLDALGFHVPLEERPEIENQLLV